MSREAHFGFSGCGIPVFPSCFSTTFLIIVVEVVTPGLPQVCKLCLGVSKGMLPVRHLAPKILNHGSQFLWAPTSPEFVVDGTCLQQKEDATPHPGVGRFSLQ